MPSWESQGSLSRKLQRGVWDKSREPGCLHLQSRRRGSSPTPSVSTLQRAAPLEGPSLSCFSGEKECEGLSRGRKNTTEIRGLSSDQGVTERRGWQLASVSCDSKPVLFGFWTFQSIPFRTIPRYIHLFNQSPWAQPEILCLERWWPAMCF